MARAGPLLPLVHLRVPAPPVRQARVRVLAMGERRPVRRRQAGAGADRGDGERDRDQHRARARAQAGRPRALAEQDRARPERVRPFLRRAQPRPSRTRGDARGSRERAARRELLGVPAEDRRRQRGLGVRARARMARSPRPAGVEHPKQRPQRLGDDGGAVRRADRDIRARRAAVPAAADDHRVPAAGGGQLPRALRVAAAEAAGRPVRSHAAGAQLEQQQRRVQRAAVPPPAPQRPPRQSDPALPGVASFRRGASAADRVRRHDPARAGAAPVAPCDGPASDRPLRRRPDACEHPSAGARTRARALRERGTRRVSDLDQPSSSTTDERDPATYRAAVRQLLRDRLLDAGRDELRGRAWAQVTMAEIAAAAGVSRQTLYNEFGTRDEFGQALVIRESSRLLDAVEQTIAEHADDPIAALTAALECFLTIATSDPFVRLLLGDDGTGGLLPLVRTQSRRALEWASQRVADAIRVHWPQAASVDLDALADTLVRLAISHVTAPSGPPAQTAAAITGLLAPSIERMLEAALPN